MASGGAIAAPAEKPAFEGYLYKRSQWLHEWRRRYFKLYVSKSSGPRLYFAKSPTEAPHGVIDLRGCLTVKSADDKTGKQHSFEVATSEQVYWMYADSDAEKDEWVGQLGRAIVLASRSYHPPADSDDDDDEDDD